MTALVCPGCGQPLNAGIKNGRCPRCRQPLIRSGPQAKDVVSKEDKATEDLDLTDADLQRLAAEGHDVGALDPAERQNTTELPAPPGPEDANYERTMSWSAEGLPPTLPEDTDLTAFLAPPQKPDELGRLGPYRILKILGSGGMGVVFHAEDLILKRHVALKAMLPGVAAKPINRQRFLREAQAMAVVRNEHVITIYQVGMDRGVPYLAMELLEGEPLDLHLVRESLPSPADVVRIGRETAEGLAAAHERGLIHRDIKPANLWLVKPRGRVVILDFGLARVAEEDASLTRSGIILGTPAFMSPEQARSLPLDGRSDLFSLGVVLYRMATGVLPFSGPDAFAVLAALTLEDPRPIWEINADVPWPLGKLITQLLAKNPDERPTDAAEVAQTLATIERELHRPTELLAPAPHAVGRSAPATDMDLGLGEIGLAGEDEELVEVEELEVLPDDPPPGTQAPALPPNRLHELTGHCLGVYDIGILIGQGHHGMVFRARDRTSGQVVALKVLSPEFPKNDAEAQRFTQAMSTAVSLRHPNLVAHYAAGKTGPYCWMAQEYIEGKSLNQLIQEQLNNPKSSWQLGVRVTCHISQALEFTKQHRLTHGNVSPKNILVRSADQTALLNDFRLFKALKGSRLHQSVFNQKLTDERSYLAPEQVDGGKTYVDFLCDLYGLAAIVYHLITGQPLFRTASLKEAIQEIRDTTPIRPRKIQKSIPREFDFVIMRMLAKHQEDRYQSPAEVLADLRPLIKAHGIKL